jgi:hypothetical protein
MRRSFSKYSVSLRNSINTQVRSADSGKRTCYATVKETIAVLYANSSVSEVYRISGLLKNQVYSTGAKWLYSTGKEIDAGAMTLVSYADATGCHTATWSALYNFPLTMPWAPSVTMNLPLGAVYVGESK